MTLPSLADIEQQAAARGLLLRLQVKQALAVTTLRVVVARPREGQGPLLLGELKGWALPLPAGLQLDTMRVQGKDTQGVGALIWAATFAWALEATPCRSARLLAIRDNDQQHRRLVRYFRQLGFEPVREVGAAVMDLPLRLVWGGAGLLMRGDIAAGLKRIRRRL
ncbi:MAG: hypothetical protein FJ057_02040 [Cyanobacteria bacterium K_DeepCast_0m_m1_088]|nr:hypothetical protein [Cyanobacteria bacterium K_DeepCast_0m_m1_088]